MAVQAESLLTPESQSWVHYLGQLLMSALFVQEKNPNGGARLLLAMGEKSRISSCRHFKDNYRATL